MPSSDFVDFIYRASRIRLGQSAKALVWRWRQICPLKIDIFTLSAPNSTNEVSMFKLAIKVCFENHFGLIHAIFLSLGSTKSGYFFLGHPVSLSKLAKFISFSNFCSGPPNFKIFRGPLGPGPVGPWVNASLITVLVY